jgi:hypothetical protein
VVVAGRWMTDDETKQWLTQRLSPRAGEFAGQTWGTGQNTPICGHFHETNKVMKSHDPARALYACGAEPGAPDAAAKLFMQQDGSELVLDRLPEGVAAPWG